nr:AAA family ATPase [Paludisphaera mucosa]
MYEQISLLEAAGMRTHFEVALSKRRHENKYLGVDDASSGEQAVVLVVLGIASQISDDSLIIIDEPEIGLHPEWQARYLDLLNNTFMGYKGCHFLLATHSPQIVAQIRGNGFVVSMDDVPSIESSKEYSKRSADFQLARLFDAPGFRNEYLAREAMTALMQINRNQSETTDFESRFEILSNVRGLLSDDDPVAEMIDAVTTAYELRKDRG